MRFRIGIVAAFIALIAASAAFASAPAAADCAVQRCVYVPLIRSAIQPTAMPTPTLVPPTQQPGIPTPAAPCDQNAPAPAEGAQAWMTVPNPARFSSTTVCARLIQNGQVVVGAPMAAVAHYKSKDTDLGSATAGADGVGRITFNIGGASAGYTVVVDVTIGGQSTSTSFTP
ncbi:MAG: hypothetical protein M3R61_00035 [Chloroflexota bacterium]|nr:hypothetical protein [Chloroflexota bacterium]